MHTGSVAREEDLAAVRRPRRIETYRLYRRPPYEGEFDFVEPRETVPLEDARPFDCSGTRVRHPRETKGLEYDVTTDAADSCCAPGDDCC